MRDPKVSSFGCFVLEVITFRQPHLPRTTWTSHVKVWVDGQVEKIYEANRDQDRYAIDDMVFGSRGLFNLSGKTKHGHIKVFRAEPKELMEKIEKAAEAVYKPHAAQIRYAPHLSDRIVKA